MKSLVCEWCGVSFERDRKQRFCSLSCTGKWKLSRPEHRAKLYTEKHRQENRRRMQKMRENKAIQEKLAEYQRSERNPIFKKEVRAKANASARRRGFQHLCGGNGRAQPRAQAILAERLGWQTEYCVRLHPAFTGRPYRYMLDIANPWLRVAIEVDGNSHRSKRVKAKDDKKASRLQLLGWTVIRFTNKEILADLEAAVVRVNNFIHGRRDDGVSA